MSNLAPTVLAMAALTLAQCAPNHFRADIGAAFAHVRGEVALQNSAGSLVLADNMQDLHDDLDLGETDTSPYLRAESDWGPQRVKISVFGSKSSGSGTLSGQFGDLPAGTAVSTDLEFLDVSGSWSYDLVSTAQFRIAPGVQVGYYALDVGVRSTSPAGFEEVDTSLLTPMPYLETEAHFGSFSMQANVGAIAIDINDSSGRYLDGEVLARLHPSRGIDLVAGYRYIVLDSNGEATGRDFDADLVISGWFIGGGVSF